MHMEYSMTANEELAFRAEVAAWMAANLAGEFACLKHRGGPGDEEAFPELRKAWERRLAEGLPQLPEQVEDPKAAGQRWVGRRRLAGAICR